jgi:hypothetical protein
MSNKIEEPHTKEILFNNLDPFLSSNRSDEKLIMDFFFVFSRFEYALKRAGYIFPNLSYAKPHWIKFAYESAAKFNRVQNPAMNAALLYLKTNPPKQQIEVNGSLGWRENASVEGEVTVKVVVHWLLSVRNNLFHGGKFPSLGGPVSEPTRDSTLISHAIVILNELLGASPQVKFYFNDIPE